MAVKLRLMRMGKKKQPTYRIVAADSRSPRDGRFIEVQGTAEAAPFDRAALDTLLELADIGTKHLFAKQREIVGKILKY